MVRAPVLSEAALDEDLVNTKVELFYQVKSVKGLNTRIKKNN
jgi:hypothetical protein